MTEVVKKEVIKLIEVCIIYPIADSKWVSHEHCVRNKGGVTIVANVENEVIPQRTIIGYIMYIDYMKLNKGTCKDHYPLLFINQMHEILSKRSLFCYLDGYSGFSKFLHTRMIKRRLQWPSFILASCWTPSHVTSQGHLVVGPTKKR
jgi:hypothetical protein